MLGETSFLKNGTIRRTLTRGIKETKYLRALRLIQPETRLWGREPGTLPSFLVIGAQRSGSTFLHDVLAGRTSARCSPLQKEVHYFDNKFYRPLGWYAKFFDAVGECGDHVKTFETSPGYLYHPAVPQRIRECLPDIKAVAVLRNPVERAISHYRWMRRCDLETRDPVEAFRHDVKQMNKQEDISQFHDPLHFDFDFFHHGYFRRSLYHVQLRRWLRYFPVSQIRVTTSNVLFEHTDDVVDKLTGFLGLRRSSTSSGDSVNRNASPDDIEIPAEARDIAERNLKEVIPKVKRIVEREMVIFGDGLFR